MKMSASGLNQTGSSRVQTRSPMRSGRVSTYTYRGGTAITAENAGDVVAAIGLHDIAFWCALKEAEPGADLCGAALALAVTTMAAQSQEGFTHGFIADCAAEAAAARGDSQPDIAL